MKYFEKIAYSISDVKGVLNDIKGMGVSFTRGRHRLSKSYYSPDTVPRGIVVKHSDNSIPDLLHEYFHAKNNHISQAYGSGMKPTAITRHQEGVANSEAIKWMKEKNTPTDKINKAEKYLKERNEGYNK